MDKQTIADELAALAGWRKDSMGVWDRERRQLNHPYPVGSLDALEAFRRERLPGVMLSYLHDYSDTNPEADPRFRCEASIVRMTDGRPDGCWIKSGRTMWSSYASALIAAAKENKPNV